MATLFKNILPIPESVVVGSGSYTVPANKYGYLSAMSIASQTAAVENGSADYGVSDSNSAVGSQWLPAGATISTSTTATNISTTSGISNVTQAVATVFINGTEHVRSTANVNFYASSGGTCRYYGTAVATWSVSLFPIPVNNLPASLTS